MISFCFHLCLASFFSSPWFHFWSWIMTFFSTVVRVLSIKREREREREKTWKWFSRTVSVSLLWWADLIFTAFSNLKHLWLLRGYEHLWRKRESAVALLIHVITVVSCQGLHIFANQPQITHVEIHFYNTSVAENGATLKNPCKILLHLPCLKRIMITTKEKRSPLQTSEGAL